MKYLLSALLLIGGCAAPTPQSQDHPTMPNAPTTKSAQALLVLDMQNDFCSPDGKMHALVAGELSRTGVIEATTRLLDAAKTRHVPAYVTPIEFDYSTPPTNLPEGIAAPIIESRAFGRGEAGGQLIGEIAERVDGASVIRLPKPSLSAFAGTDLDRRLRDRGVEEVVIAGLLTNFCVESTARDAFDLGYRVRIVGDATAGFDSTQSNFALETIFPMLGRVITADEFASAPSLN